MTKRSTRFRMIMVLLVVGLPSLAAAQQSRKKPQRALPPKLDQARLRSVFFEDVLRELKGEPPSQTPNEAAVASPRPSSTTTGRASGTNDDEESGWAKVISPLSLEDLIKESKQRLDEIITTPAKFAGGGFQDARREFSLLSFLFAIVEQHPSQVRWKNSSKVARVKMARVSASSKVGSSQAYEEAKRRLQDLSDLMNGTTLTDNVPTEDLIWSELVDRAPLMQSMEFALREKLIKLSADASAFEDGSEEFTRMAELVGAIGQLLIQPGMPDAEDSDYAKWSRELIEHSQAAVQSAKLGAVEAAKEAASKMDQTCSNCHEAGFG